MYYLLLLLLGDQSTLIHTSLPDAEASSANSVPCLVAVGRLQVTSSPNCADLNSQASPTEFMSRHSTDGKFTFVDQR